jgi:hypothetical protein
MDLGEFPVTNKEAIAARSIRVTVANLNSPVERVMVRGSFLTHAEIRELRSQFKSIKGG